MKKIFLAGIIQGSAKDKSIYPQDYRKRIREIFARAYPEAEIHDPFDGHEDSVNYDDGKSRAVFQEALDIIAKCDLMIAHLPHASLGTAIEMWHCHNLAIPVWTITPMKDNWIVRFCSNRIFEDIDKLAEHLHATSATSLKES